MKKLLVCTLFATIALASNAAFARNIWRECGIGAMIFKNTGWAAITSNIIWDLGTTATSSNASSDDLCEGSAASTAKFVNETYANLEEEVAVGEGKHLTAMLNMLGCNGNRADLVNGIRTDLKQQMSDANYSAQSKTQNAEKFFESTMTRAQAAQCASI